MSSFSTSLGVFLLFLFMILGTSPECHTAARILEDFPQDGTSPPHGGENEIKSVEDDPSKGQAHRSQPRGAPSATGPNVPSGSVQISPPTTTTNLSYVSSNSSTPSGNSTFSRESSVSSTNNSTSTPTSSSTFKSFQNHTATQQKSFSRSTSSGGVGQNNLNFSPPGFEGNFPSPFPPAPPFP